MKLSREAWQAIHAVKEAPGGGLHRYELAGLLEIPPGQLWPHLGAAYRLKLIDLCRDYVVTPPATPAPGTPRPRP
jgi:hypothetical protein